MKELGSRIEQAASPRRKLSLRRRYSNEVMRQAWEFVCKDFDRLLDLLDWLDGLTDPEYEGQAASLEHLHGGSIDAVGNPEPPMRDPK